MAYQAMKGGLVGAGPGGQISRKIQFRLMWPLTVLLLLNSLDRVNISFGALQMNQEIGLNAADYGLGVGVFFLGYILLQIPSVWALKRWGARRWLFAIVVSWGAAATAMAFIRTVTDFYSVRLLLGCAESGFAPGVIYLAATWMPIRYRGAAVATVMLAVPISLIVGGPVCAWLMSQENPLGLSGWRWMSLLEGSLTVVLAFACLRLFADDPKDAAWLSHSEKDWLRAELQREDAATAATATSAAVTTAIPAPRPGVIRLIADARVWLCAGMWFALMAGLYGVVFWLPLIVRQWTGGTPLQVSFVTALPWIASMVGSVLNARHSDRRQERFWHCSLALLTAALGLALAVATSSPIAALASLLICGLGLGGAQSTFWTIPPTFLGRANGTIGVPMINMLGNTSGFLGPYLIGVIHQRTGSFTAALYTLALLLALAAVFAQLLRKLAVRTAIAATRPGFTGEDHDTALERVRDSRA
jgi:MFS transporter, ACS family, tartrate transporter